MSSNRRDFLKKSGLLGGAFLTASVIDTLAFRISASFIQQARAEEIMGSADPRFLVNIWIGGGPMRYSFDQWVRLYDDDNIVTNPYVSTAYSFNNGRLQGLEYKTFKYNGLNIPHIFSLPVKNGSGSNRLATDILNDMFVIRGFGTSFDGHDTNSLLVQTPVAGLPSLHGLLADSSERLFAAVLTGQNASGFVSQKNKASTMVGTGDGLRDLMSGFARTPATTKAAVDKETYRAAYDNAMAYLKSYARSNRLGASILNKNLDNAAARMKQGINDIDGYWDAAVNRYRTAVEGTARMTGVPGISESTVSRNQIENQAQFSIFGIASNAAQRNFMTALDYDLREMNSQMTFGHFYQQLALAEYCVAKELSSSVSIGMGNFDNIRLRTGSINGDDVNNRFVNGDQLVLSHTDMDGSTGAYTALMLTHSYYSGLLAGILELRDNLKAVRRASNGNDLWSETVVQVSSEFARDASIGGTFSGHGYRNMVTSAFSGSIKGGPYVIGNIRRDGGNGTNGLAAPIDGYLSGPPSTASVTSTLSRLMRLNKNPWENTAPAMISFNESTGVISSLVGRPKVV